MAALIIVEDIVERSTVAAVPLAEFQARRALDAGAAHIVFMTERVGARLLGTIDRLRGEGIAVDVTRNAAEVASAVHPQEAVLLVAAGTLLDGEHLAALAERTDAALLCVEFGAGATYELIDAATRWTGFARLDAALVRETAGEAGDWDLASLLLRRAVQQDTARIVLGGEAAAAALTQVAGTPDEALTQKLIASGATSRGGWATRQVTEPAARAAARWLVGRGGQAAMAMLLAGLAALGGAASGLFGVVTAALMVTLLAEIAHRASQVLQTATGRRAALAAWHGRFRAAAWTICAVTTGVTLTGRTGQWGCVVLALVAVAALVLDHQASRQRTIAVWEADPPALALIMLAALVAGQPVLGLATVALYAFATLAVPMVHRRHA